MCLNISWQNFATCYLVLHLSGDIQTIDRLCPQVVRLTGPACCFAWVFVAYDQTVRSVFIEMQEMQTESSFSMELSQRVEIM